MQSNVDILLEKLKKIKIVDCNQISYSLPVNLSAAKDLYSRLVFVEAGNLVIECGEGGKKRKTIIPEGHVVYALPEAPSGGGIQTEVCHTYVIAFFPEYIRLVSYTLVPKGGGGMSFCYYHTPGPLIAPGRLIVEALNQLVLYSVNMRSSAVHLIQALLTLVEKQVDSSCQDEQISKSHARWKHIENYLSNNLASDLSRYNVAGKFRINHSYLSSLCRKYSNKGYNEYVRLLRLRHSKLLLELNLSLDEIAERCGFQYTSYFIRCFKQAYGVSPGKFRLN